jgi:hypothetical protein
MPGEYNANLLEFLYRLSVFDSRLKKAEDRAGALAQQAKLLIPNNNGLAMTPPPPPNTTVSGTLTGCTLSGIPGTVDVMDGMGLLGTFTASGAGSWSGSIYLATNTSCTITATPSSPRLAATSIVRTLTAGGSNVALNISASPAAGYACTKACSFPLKTTLNLTSIGLCSGVTYPADTLTYQSLPAWLVSLGISVGWLGTATWSATYGLNTSVAWQYLFFVNSLGQLKLNAVELAGHKSVALATATLGSCPGSATTPLFTCSTNCATQQVGVTIAE